MVWTCWLALQHLLAECSGHCHVTKMARKSLQTEQEAELDRPGRGFQDWVSIFLLPSLMLLVSVPAGEHWFARSEHAGILPASLSDLL